MSLDFILEHLIPKSLKEGSNWDQSLIVFVGFEDIEHINNRMMGLKRKFLVDWFHAMSYLDTYNSFKQRHFVMPDMVLLKTGWDIRNDRSNQAILGLYWDYDKFITMIDETLDKMEKLT